MSGVRSGLIWSFGERITAQIVSALVTIVLARILEPAQYGAISLATVFITVCNVFVTSGMGSAIVQKKVVNEEDYATAFIIGISIAAALYALIFFISPVIASFYKMPELKWVFRVMALRLPVAAINNIQQARIRREMAFKRFFIATLFGTVISGIVGIGMAVTGFGVWALVAQYLTNTTVDTLVLVIVEKWFPGFRFNRLKAKEIFSFGSKVLLTDLVYTVESEIRTLIIGKAFGPTDLAYFEQGKKYPAILVNNINASINKVMLPVYSSKQDNIAEIKEMLRKSVRIGIYVMAPVLVGFAAIAPTFVPVVLTEKWNMCIPFIQILSLSCMTRPIESSCHQALLGVGKSGTVLMIMVIINATDLLLVLTAIFIFHSTIMVAWGTIASTTVSLCCFLIQSNVNLGYKVKEQMADMLQVLSMSAFMGAVVWLIGKTGPDSVLKLGLQVLAGIFVYYAGSALLKPEGYGYCLGIIKKYFGRRGH